MIDKVYDAPFMRMYFIRGINLHYENESIEL